MTMTRLFTALLLAMASAQLAASQQHQPAKPDHMDHKFDDPARFARSFDDPARDAWQMPARVIDALQLTSGMAVADIGAGTGYFSTRLARVPGVRVFAVDIEPKMIDYLQQRAQKEGLTNITGVLGGATSANLPQPVDLVLIVDTYHHLPDRPTYFRQLRKSLTPGGRIAIVDFRKDAPDGPPAHFRFTPQQIQDEMKEAGYELHATHDFLPRQHFLIFR